MGARTRHWLRRSRNDNLAEFQGGNIVNKVAAIISGELNKTKEPRGLATPEKRTQEPVLALRRGDFQDASACSAPRMPLDHGRL